VALGIDLYRYQTVTNPQAINVSFAWVKATDGNGLAAVHADHQVAQMKAAKIPVGLYHYAQPGNPVAQADLLLSEVRRLKADGLAPALDLESPFTANSAARNFGVNFCKRVRQMGYRPAVYMSGSFAAALRPDQWGIPGLVIWIASYGPNDGARHAPTGGYAGRYDVHQFTSVGQLAGINGQVDLNWSTTNITNTVEEEMELGDKFDRATWNDKPSTVGWMIEGIRQLAESARLTAGQARASADAAQAAIAGVPAAVVAAFRDGVNPTDPGSVDIAALAAAVADELDRRNRDGNPNTGQVS
jgi:GH25 family lysozyme M1 (1,4-beta-N-acetylmuramidase)